MLLPIATAGTHLLESLEAFTVMIVVTGVSLTLVLAVVDGSMKISEMASEFKSRALGRSGQIGLNEFAISSNVHIAVARWYLDRKARYFGGLKEVDDVGDLIYLFGEGKRKFLRSQIEL